MAFKLKGSHETEIFINERAYVAISQPDPMGEEPSVIELSKDQLEEVANELLRIASDPDQWPDEDN